jgi:hypothetical protein
MARSIGGTRACRTARRPFARALLALALLQGCVRPPERPLEFAPIGMHPTGQYTATADGAVTFSGGGTLRLDLYMRAGLLTVTVLTAGIPEAASARLTVALDDRPAEAVAAGSQPETVVRLPIERAGMHALSLRAESIVRIQRVLVLSGG